MSKPTNAELDHHEAVTAAARHLRSTGVGMRVHEAGWTCVDGVLDLAAQDGRTFVACIVRSRRAGGAVEAAVLTPRKRARMRRIAVRWCVAHRYLFDEVRVDMATVTLTDGGHLGDALAVELVRAVG